MAIFILVNQTKNQSGKQKKQKNKKMIQTGNANFSRMTYEHRALKQNGREELIADKTKHKKRKKRTNLHQNKHTHKTRKANNWLTHIQVQN